ncbi:MAG: hypothetical protein RLZZ584_2183 [Pseudomonadota bacterium]
MNDQIFGATLLSCFATFVVAIVLESTVAAPQTISPVREGTTVGQAHAIVAAPSNDQPVAMDGRSER